MFYKNRLACATQEEIEEVISDYLSLYPKFDKSQPTIEEYISMVEAERMDGEF